MLLRQSQQAIYSLQQNNEFLKQLSRNYDLNNSKCSSKSRQQRLQHNQIYEMQMQRCNSRWVQIKQKSHQILFKVDSYNSSRCNFTTRQQIKLIKMVNKLVGNQTIEDSLAEYQDLIFESSELSLQIKDQIRDKIGRLNLLEDKPLHI